MEKKPFFMRLDEEQMRWAQMVMDAHRKRSLGEVFDFLLWAYSKGYVQVPGMATTERVPDVITGVKPVQRPPEKLRKAS